MSAERRASTELERPPFVYCIPKVYDEPDADINGHRRCSSFLQIRGTPETFFLPSPNKNKAYISFRLEREIDMQFPGWVPSFFALSVVLLVAPTGGVQPASAQTPAFDETTPLSSLRQAIRNAESDTMLIDLATALLEARKKSSIAHSTYRKGVWAFQQLRPTFYGNFFGDPFFASYDARYQRLTWKRQTVEMDINPSKHFWDDTAFFCNPLWYDPAVGGVCKGFRFAASDFFFLPSFLAHRESALPSFPSLLPDRPAAPRPQRTHAARVEGPREPGRSPVSPDRVVSRATPVDMSASDRVRLPDVTTRMQTTASRMRRVEIRARLQQFIDEEYGGRENLTARQQNRLASEAKRILSSPTEQTLRPAQLRDRLDPRSSRHFHRERSPEARRARTGSRTIRSSPTSASNPSSPSGKSTVSRTPTKTDEQ